MRRAARAARRRCGSSRPTRRRHVHPQTVIEHFGSWNARQARGRARAAPLRDPRGAARPCRELGEELGRVPTARDIDEHRGKLPSKSLYWHTFGFAHERAARGWLRRAGGRGAAGARARPGGQPLEEARPSAEVRGLDRRRARPTTQCSPSGRSIECSTPGAGPGRRSSSSYGNGYARPASTWPPTGRSASGARLVSGGGSTASRLRQATQPLWCAHGREWCICRSAGRA